MTRKEAREQAFLVLFQYSFFINSALEEILESSLKNGTITENKFHSIISQHDRNQGIKLQLFKKVQSNKGFES